MIRGYRNLSQPDSFRAGPYRFQYKRPRCMHTESHQGTARKEYGDDRLGYHEYQSIWDNPLADEDLLCEREARNSHDPQAIAINYKV